MPFNIFNNHTNTTPTRGQHQYDGDGVNNCTAECRYAKDYTTKTIQSE